MAETAQEVQSARDVDEEQVLADAWRRSLYGVAGAAAAWTVGAVLFAVAHVGIRLAGPEAVPHEMLRIASSVAGLVGVAGFSWSRLTHWRGEIRTMDGRLQRWRANRRLRWVQLAVVLTLGFLAGMLFWEVQFEAWGLFFVALGYPLTLLAGYRVWEKLDEDGKQLLILGWATAGVYPVAAVVLPQLAEPVVVGGYALVAAGFAQSAVRFDADDVDEQGDRDDRDEAQAEPSR